MSKWKVIPNHGDSVQVSWKGTDSIFREGQFITNSELAAQYPRFFELVEGPSIEVEEAPVVVEPEEEPEPEEEEEPEPEEEEDEDF